MAESSFDLTWKLTVNTGDGFIALCGLVIQIAVRRFAADIVQRR